MDQRRHDEQVPQDGSQSQRFHIASLNCSSYSSGGRAGSRQKCLSDPHFAEKRSTLSLFSMKVIRFCTKAMKAMATFAVAVVWMTAGVCASGDSKVALTVRLYNTSAISARELLAARRTS